MEIATPEVLKLDCLRLAVGLKPKDPVELATAFYEFVSKKPAIETVDELKAAIRQWVDKVS